MPTWKIKTYWFYFKVNDIVKSKPAHIHVETAKGEIQFWLESIDTKATNEIKVKKIKGIVSEKEQNEIKKIVQQKQNIFLKIWNQRKNQTEE